MGGTGSSSLHIVGDSNFDTFPYFFKKTNAGDLFPRSAREQTPHPAPGTINARREVEQSWTVGCSLRLQQSWSQIGSHHSLGVTTAQA